MLNYFLTASLVTLLTHGYLALRLLPALAPGARLRRLFLALLLGNVLLLPGTLVLTLHAAPPAAGWAVPLAHAAFTDVGFCILLTAGLLLRDVIWAAGVLLSRVRCRLRVGGGTVQERARELAPLHAQRRQALLHGLNLAVGGAAGAATLIGYGLALAQPIVRRVRIPCARVPVSWAERGLRIVQISDLHVGPTIRRAYVEALCRRVNALGADLIVITGDLVDGYVSQLHEQVEPLRSLRARHGVYFVTGNHEYFYRGAQWCQALSALGLRVLEDARAIIEHEGARVLLVGLSDPSARTQTTAERRAALTPLLGTATEAELRILLTHRPGDVQLLTGPGMPGTPGMDLQLSGHMHGGQFFPLTTLLQWTEPYVAGLYRVRDLWLYVNRGAGYWGPPNRLGVRQEITLVELTRNPEPYQDPGLATESQA